MALSSRFSSSRRSPLASPGRVRDRDPVGCLWISVTDRSRAIAPTASIASLASWARSHISGRSRSPS